MSEDFSAVYIIYSADVISESDAEVERMSPTKHIPAGYPADSEAYKERAAVAAKFTKTEGDDQYDYGYLGDESGDPRYFPAGYVDAKGLELAPEPTDCPDCGGAGVRSTTEAERVAERDGISVDQARGYCGTCEASGTLPPFAETKAGCGYHRKWVGELTADEWQTFAQAYLIDVDDRGFPEHYEPTMGSLTAEHGHIDAVAIDNREGWESESFGYGRVYGVLDSQFYVSFAFEQDPARSDV